MTAHLIDIDQIGSVPEAPMLGDAATLNSASATAQSTPEVQSPQNDVPDQRPSPPIEFASDQALIRWQKACFFKSLPLPGTDRDDEGYVTLSGPSPEVLAQALRDEVIWHCSEHPINGYPARPVVPPGVKCELSCPEKLLHYDHVGVKMCVALVRIEIITDIPTHPVLQEAGTDQSVLCTSRSRTSYSRI